METAVIIAIALGSVLGIIIFAFLFIAVFFRKKLKRFLRRNNMNAVYKPSIEDPDHQSISTFETNSTELSRYAFIKSCSKKLENNKQLLHEEFQNLPDYTLSKSSSVSKQKANRLKNRYSNIDAFNHTRVILHDRTPSEDYINANFVQGFVHTKKFIATQGPKGETIDDFWRMIYLHNVKAIVMLTNLVENGVKKCHQYWPNVMNKPVQYGDCQVTLAEEVVISDYVKRRFDLLIIGADNKKISSSVYHYYYQKWYDRGVPDTYPISILKLIRDVNENHPSNDDYPIVVHCSAGVGRTGTYITLDAMLENLNTSENFIDIFEFVSKIRAQRSYLVQTIAQYIFIYDALSDYCIFGFTDIKAGRLQETYEKLKKQAITGGRKNSKEIDQLQVEFDKLNIQKSLMTSIQTAQEYPELNRDPTSNLCYDDNRVKLKGTFAQGYINATHTLDSFIITQDPMKATVHQFWRMILEHNIKLVVSLNKDFMSEYNQLGWPTSENPCCLLESNDVKYEIKLLDDTMITNIDDDEGSENNSEEDIILVRYIKVLDHSTQKEFHVTNLILNKQWPTNTRPDDTWSCLEFIKRIGYFYELEYRKSPNILVHGYGGDSNCLLVCALYVLVDQLIFENSVDIFNVVKYLNTQRYNTKINYDQYDYLYKCLTELPTNKKKSN